MPQLSDRELLRQGRFKVLQKRGRLRIPDLTSALQDHDWRLRRNALRVLDHIPNAGCAQEIAALLEDEHASVRKWAAHALGCDRCKPGDTTELDPVPQLIRVAESDPSLDVRRAAVVCLAWNRPVDSRITAFLERLLASATDPKILLHAEQGHARHAKGIASV